MGSIRIGIVFFFTIFCGVAFAGGLSDFVLTDGSVIRGRLVSYKNGGYTIQTKGLGVITVNESRVKLIRRAGDASGSAGTSAGASAAAGGLADPQVRGLVSQMQENGEIMALINALRDDPDMQEILNDPSMMQAISAGDLSTLMASPRFMKLLENGKVREIQRKLGQ